MSHSCETFANRAIEALATLETEGEAEVDGRIVAGIHTTWDEMEGSVALAYRSEPETLLRLEAKVSGQPRWLTFNIDLGAGAFAAGDVIGLVADIASDEDCSLEMFVRSATETGDVDTELSEALSVSSGRSVATALHVVAADDGMARADKFHMLGIRLPKQHFRLDIRGLRVLVRPAAEASAAPAAG